LISMTHRDVLKIFPNLKARTLISWSEKGLLSPSVGASGSGSRRIYSEKNLIEIGVIRELVDYRFPTKIVKPIIDALGERLDKQKGDYDIVIVYSKQRIAASMDADAWVADLKISTRSKFKYEAANLVFGERPLSDGSFARTPYTGSAVVISVADIWDYIQERA
jgi:DNA-binding transcriptional MerR regulator